MKIKGMLILCCLGWIVPAQLLALTVEEILLLKQNGVAEDTIQMMLQSEMQAQSQYDSTAGQPMGTRTINRPDGQSAIVYSTGGGDTDTRDAEERLKEEQAWRMLRDIIVDTRKGNGSGRRPAD
jgi:hypothetical protein